MRKMMLWGACVVLGFGTVVGEQSTVCAEGLPDLVVTKIGCAPPSSKLEFSVTNKSPFPLKRGWKARAEVHFGRTKAGFVDLGSPTSGSIGPAGGTATYLTAFGIVSPVTVKVILLPTIDIRESNDGNNIGTQSLVPCGQPVTPAGSSPVPQPVPRPGKPAAMPEPIPRPGAMPEPIPTPPIPVR